MIIWGILTSLLVGILILQYLNQLWSSRNYPPGPVQLPIIGGLWRVGRTITQDKLMKMAKQYGNMYTLWAGSYPIVILSGYQAVKEGLINHAEEFSGRPVTPASQAICRNGGFLTSNGHTWRQHRRFGQVTLQKLGLGKKHTEDVIEEEALGLVEVFARTKGHPIDPMLPVTSGIFKVACAVVWGNQYHYSEKETQTIIEHLAMFAEFGDSIYYILYEMMPRLMEHFSTPFTRAVAIRDSAIALLKEEIAKHKKHEMQHYPQDFTDFYLHQIEKTKRDPDSTFNEDNLAQCILELLAAGTETTGSTLQWALFLMATHPDIQDKVHKEMEEVLGTSQSICYQDRKQLPYTNAVIHEVVRAKYVFPLGVARRTTKDVTMYGYSIPKRTIVLADLASVLLDRKQWETPEEFNPNHFLDKDGHFVAREEFLPFGAGTRVCPGEQLARMELFLFFTHLMRAFRFQFPEETGEMTKVPVLGFTFHPQPYKICAIPRSDSSQEKLK
ncbi:cytochrome P450 2C26 isoform X1 [Anolis carolinensis]|uniref:cytochrome P450 2C26 isoform X1 n=1 Tax=Anolis carolinensis TaxID=28377 RepID=UPI002F2B7BFF